MNRNKYENKEKTARKLFSELNSLTRKKWNMESIPLKEPIHHGYIKRLVFRDETKRRKDFEQIKSAFEFCGQTEVWSKTIDFKVKSKKIVSIKRPHFKSVCDPRLRWFPSEERRLEAFALLEKHKKHLSFHVSFGFCDCHEYSNTDRFVTHYGFRNKWMLEEQISPNWLTHYKPVDGELESKIKEIEMKLDHADLRRNYGCYKSFNECSLESIKADSHGIYHGWPIRNLNNIYEDIEL